MGLPIAQITVLKFIVADVKSEANNHKMLGYIDESGIPVVVRFYKKAEDFKHEAGDNLIVIGKPIILNSKSLIIDAEILMETTPESLAMNYVLVAGTMAAPRDRTHPKAPVKFGLCVDHYDREAKEKLSYWFNISIWGMGLESKRLNLLNKGQNISVQGRLILSKYKDKPQFEVSTRDFCLLPSKKSEGQSQAVTTEPSATTEVFDEIPF